MLSIEKSKKVLSHYWTSIIEEGGLGLFSLAMASKEMLERIYIASPKSQKGRQSLYLVAFLQVAKEGNGLRELRSILTKNGTNDRTWYRMMNEYKQAISRLNAHKPREWVDQIRKQIFEYVPFRIKSSN